MSTPRRQLAAAAAASGTGGGDHVSGTAPWAEQAGSAGFEDACGDPPAEEREEEPHIEEKEYDFSEPSGGEEGGGEAEVEAGPAVGEGRAVALAADKALAAAAEADPEGQIAGEEQEGAEVVSQGKTPACRCWLVGSTRQGGLNALLATSRGCPVPDRLHATWSIEIHLMPHPLARQDLGRFGELAAAFQGGPLLWALSRGPEALLTALIDSGANRNLRDAGAVQLFACSVWSAAQCCASGMD